MLKMEIRAISQDFVTLLLNFDQLYDMSPCVNLSSASASVLPCHAPVNLSNGDDNDNHRLLQLIDSSFDGHASINDASDDESSSNKRDAIAVAPPGGMHTARVLPPGARLRHDSLVRDISAICVAPNTSLRVAHSPTDLPPPLNSTAIGEVKVGDSWSTELMPLYHTPVSDFHAKHSSADTLSSADESTPIVRPHRYNQPGWEDTPTMTEDSLCRLGLTNRYISGFCSADWHQTDASDDKLSDVEHLYLDGSESDGDGDPVTPGVNLLTRITSSLEVTRDSEPNFSVLTTPSSGTKSSDVTSSSIHFSPATSCVESSYKESDGGASCSTSPHSDTRCRLHRVLQRNISRERLMARIARQRFLASSSTGVSSDSVNDRPPPTNSPNSNDVSPMSNDRAALVAVPFGARPPCIGKEATPEGVNKTMDNTTCPDLASVDLSDLFPDQFVIPAECKYNNVYVTSVTTQPRTPKRHAKTCHKTRTSGSVARGGAGARGGGGKRKTHPTPGSTTKKPALLRRLQNWGKQLRSGARHNPGRYTPKRGAAGSNTKDKEEEEEL